jgi:hypothetical protein
MGKNIKLLMPNSLTHAFIARNIPVPPARILLCWADPTVFRKNT